MPADKAALLDEMSGSLSALQTLALRDAALTTRFLSRNSSNEFETLGLLQDNFAVLKLSVLGQDLQISPTNQSSAWNHLIGIFDRADIRDIRSVLDQAVVRQREKSELAQADLAGADFDADGDGYGTRQRHRAVMRRKHLADCERTGLAGTVDGCAGSAF